MKFLTEAQWFAWYDRQSANLQRDIIKTVKALTNAQLPIDVAANVVYFVVESVKDIDPNVTKH